MPEVEVISVEAFQEARRRAKYGHKNWIVWKLMDGNHAAAVLTLESLEIALAECVMSKDRRGQDRPCIDLIHASDGTALRGSAALVEVWRNNLKAGMRM